MAGYGNTTTELDPIWSEYDMRVANCQMRNYGKVYLDEYGCPIDDEYSLGMDDEDLLAVLASI